MVKVKSYKEHLLQQLRKPEEASAYLKAALESGDPHTLSLALEDIEKAQVSLQKINIDKNSQNLKAFRTK